MSVSSDFSIIPDSMVNLIEEENNQIPISMNVSFMRNEESSAISSTFNKVTFLNIQSLVNTDNELEGSVSVSFYCTDDMVMTQSDRIALYKVGFSSSKAFLCFEWVPIPNSQFSSLTEQATAASLTNIPITVTLKAQNLPSDKEELYQICYLRQDGQIAGVSVPFQLLQIKKTEVTYEVENAARNVLSLRVQALVQEQNELRESIQDLETVCNNLRSENEGLSEVHEEVKEKLQFFMRRSMELEELDAKLQAELEQIKMEMIEKDDRIKKGNSTIDELQLKLTSAVVEMTELRRNLELVQDKNAVTQERQKVLIQDNDELNTCLQYSKKDLDQALKEKEAAEKIASDLSQRLQTACDEYQSLAKINLKLIKKLKKIKRELDIRDNMSSEGFFCVEQDKGEEDDGVNGGLEETDGNRDLDAEVSSRYMEDTDVNKDDLEDVEGNVSVSNQSIQANAMVESVALSTMTSLCHSNCSQNTKELTEVFSQKMEDIISQLSQQKHQINTLKEEIERSRYHIQHTSVSSQVSNTESEEKQKSADTNASAPQMAEGTFNASLSDTQKEAKMIKVYRLNAPDDDKKVLYSHSFLPTSCTAPVFFPPPVTEQPPRSYLPTAPSPPPSVTVTDSYAIINADSILQGTLNPVCDNSSPQSFVDQSQPQFAQQTVEDPATNLPPPLLPETTMTARNAAVLKQFINESTMTTPQFQEQVPSVTNSSCNTETQSLNQDCLPPNMLRCPMCPLTFEVNGIHLLEEHTNSHLERVCPVCSTAFARNTKQEEFEVHVHSHFQEEESRSGFVDASGPWGEETNRSFHLLEID